MLLSFLRIWLPAGVTLAGVVVMIAGGGDDISLEGGAGIVGAGLAIWLMNVLFRIGLGNDRDRDAEDAARDFYDLHGHWPDEPPPAPRRPAGGDRTLLDPHGPGPVARPRTIANRGRARPRRPG